MAAEQDPLEDAVVQEPNDDTTERTLRPENPDVEHQDADDTNNMPVSAANKAPATPLFALPDLREREDGGAISFENDLSSAHDVEVSEEMRTKSRAEFTTVYDIIDALEDQLSQAKTVLFQPSLVKVDRNAIFDDLARLKDMLPVQLERASALMREAERRLRTAQTQANSVVASAQSQAAQLIAEAQERAQFLAGQENVTALANKKAREIVATAQAKSDKLTSGADEYCLSMMDSLKQQLDKLEQDVQSGQHVLQERRQVAARKQAQLAESLNHRDGEE